MYTREQAYNETLQYFNGDTLATNVWIDKYALKDLSGNILEKTPDDMHRRLSKEFARIERKYPNPLKEEEIYQLLKDFKYIVPQGRVMAGLGVYDSYRSLSNCLVLPTPLDSYNSIMRTDNMLVNAAKRGNGYGIDLSKIRPNKERTTNAASTSTGVVPFMERYSNSTREVGQDSRRGACLLGIDISHPESMDFAKAKVDKSKITGANISLKVDNKFFESVENNADYDLVFNNKVYKTINASDFLNEISELVHNSAEPGIFIWDRIKEYDPVSVYKDHQITLTNACGEQPMSEYDTCRLIVTNLVSYIDDPFTSKSKFNKSKFKDHCKQQIRLSDDLVDLELEYIDRIINKIKSDPEPESHKVFELELWKNIKDKAIKGRRVGSGITGLADMLAANNIQYGNKESLSFINDVMYEKMDSELESMIELSKERGSFKDYDYNKEYKNDIPQNVFFKFLKETYPNQIEKMKTYGRRNINWSTIAPVGSTSLLTQTTSGCEPAFNIFYNRKRKVDELNENKSYKDENGDWFEEYKIFHKNFIEWYSITSGLNNIEESLNFLKNSSDEMIEKLIKESPYIKSCANEVYWKDRINIQSLLQKYITSAISSTVNLPSDIKVEDIKNIYLTAWESGCKGVTVYREGSRSGILTNKKQDVQKIEERPKEVNCDINHLTIQGVKWIVLIGIINDIPYEVFCLKDKELPKKYRTGKIIKVKSKVYDLQVDDDGTICNITSEFNNPLEGALTRQISLNLKHTPLEDIYIQLQKEGSVNDFNKAISRTFKKYLKDKGLKSKCPECGSNLVMESGCVLCRNCGYSQCG